MAESSDAKAAKEAKKTLRKSIKERLSSLSEKDISEQSQTAQSMILSLPQYKDAKRISIYLSMPTGEARTGDLLRDALRVDKQVFVPYIHSVPQPETKSGKGKVIDMLRLRSLEDYESLERDSWGIPTLPAESIADRENALGGKGVAGSENAPEADGSEGGVDVVIMPGVAFDQEGSRLGHGAGFYDSYLSRYCAGGARRKPFLVGLCLAEQLLPPRQILMRERDWSVDAIAVGDGRLLKPQTAA